LIFFKRIFNNKTRPLAPKLVVSNLSKQLHIIKE
jgi:hypothetical protein